MLLGITETIAIDQNLNAFTSTFKNQWDVESKMRTCNVITLFLE